MDQKENFGSPKQATCNLTTAFFPWYDSYWLFSYTNVCKWLQKHLPHKLKEFMQAFEVLKTPPEFKTQHWDQLLAEDDFKMILERKDTLKQAEMEKHEFFEFGRLVLHDDPVITAIQKKLCVVVEELTGESVECSYNFLSLYNSLGVLTPHLDAPSAKWTIDLCLDQSTVWPIWLSDVQPWPLEGLPKNEDWAEAIKLREEFKFKSYELQPGNAILFSGTSQWHYRERLANIGALNHCDMLFFHFIPTGTYPLVHPRKWAQYFGIPELSELVSDY